MATAKTAGTLFSSLRTSFPRSSPLRPVLTQYQQRRSFLPNPLASPSPETLTATRTVPYPASTVYAIISDVASYSSFVPFCTSSTVTRTSPPDSQGRSWPEQAILTVGFTEGISESFESRVYCAPETVVEAVSGPRAESTLATDKPSSRPADDPTRKDSVLTHLRTRWELRPFPYKPGPLRGDQNAVEQKAEHPVQHQTEVMLSIEYAFANPLYAVMSKAAAPKLAERMIEAFEKRIGHVVHRPSSAGQTSVLRH
ncbi:hypothetical protein K461DRAFT_273685 [Myriangium duriaei CBS 260.36]|uniref:Coenzyme Q-binding protein COQ10 START domain-containing protein n=1 Tax=Myriangium duriaei CBS 260.36 TaxID=1168546 RepID=A0A9P4JEF5_9PEZI|nr:hypothetical protein K461DRAFT_273685 [Myriangium duriaei CBS 260.36]